MIISSFSMSKLLLSLVLFSLIGCSPISETQPQFQNIVWVNSDLKFDTIYAPDRSSYSIYGSGTLLYLGSNHTFKSFSNMFINANDSIAWGEPGVVISKGHWKVSEATIVTEARIATRTFSPVINLNNKTVINSYEVSGDTLIQNDKTRFIPAKLLTQELDLVMRGSKGHPTTAN